MAFGWDPGKIKIKKIPTNGVKWCGFTNRYEMSNAWQLLFFLLQILFFSLWGGFFFVRSTQNSFDQRGGPYLRARLPMILMYLLHLCYDSAIDLFHPLLSRFFHHTALTAIPPKIQLISGCMFVSLCMCYSRNYLAGILRSGAIQCTRRSFMNTLIDIVQTQKPTQ